jgi:ribosomal protein L32E
MFKLCSANQYNKLKDDLVRKLNGNNNVYKLQWTSRYKISHTQFSASNLVKKFHIKQQVEVRVI